MYINYILIIYIKVLYWARKQWEISGINNGNKKLVDFDNITKKLGRFLMGCNFQLNSF